MTQSNVLIEQIGSPIGKLVIGIIIALAFTLLVIGLAIQEKKAQSLIKREVKLK